MMKNWLFIFSALLLLATGCTKRPDAPVLQLPNDTIDVGVLYIDGEPGTFDVPVENIGGKPLNIFAIESNCDCVTGTPPGVIKGGGKGQFQVTINVSNYLPQPLELTVFVYSNDFKSPARVTFKGTVRMKDVVL